MSYTNILKHIENQICSIDGDAAVQGCRFAKEQIYPLTSSKSVMNG
jgi:phage regulator Rha-like protein